MWLKNEEKKKKTCFLFQVGNYITVIISDWLKGGRGFSDVFTKNEINNQLLPPHHLLHLSKKDQSTQKN